MSRSVVMLLLAANLLYFGWSHWAVRERPVLTAVTSAGGHDPTSAAPAALPCTTLGPFHDEQPARQAEKQLAAAGWQPQRRATSEDISDGWWVYVPNASATAQARTLDMLRHSGVRDAAAMPNDDAQFRVSVGLFSDQERAQERANRLQRLKVDAVVKEHHRQQPAIWFDLPGVTAEALRDAHLDSAGLPLDALHIGNCPATPSAPPAEARGIARAAAGDSRGRRV